MSETKVVTGKVRFSFANVFEPKAASNEPGAKLKYSAMLLIPKTDKVTLAKVEAAIAAAIELGKSKLGTTKTLKLPLRDGDEKEGEDYYEEVFKGHMFVNANSDNKPGVVDQDLNAILDKQEFYSGCYGRASVNFYAFAIKGNKGIACGLNHVQKLEDGENLAGGTSAEEDFGEDLM